MSETRRRKQTPIGILSYPKLFTPEPKYQGQGDLVYSLAIICDPQNPEVAQVLQRMQQEEATLKAQQWPAGTPAGWRSCFIDGNITGDPHSMGKIILRLRSDTSHKPIVYDNNLAICTQEMGLVYGGCVGRATYEMYAYTKGSQGIALSLGDVQWLGHGQKLGGGAQSHPDDFQAVEAGAYDRAQQVVPNMPGAMPVPAVAPSPMAQPPMQPVAQPPMQPVVQPAQPNAAPGHGIPW